MVGVRFKPGESVLWHSPGLAFTDGLQVLIGEAITFYDPLFSQEALPWMAKVADEQWTKEYMGENFDAVAICVRQHGVDFTILEDPQGVAVHSCGKDETAAARRMSMSSMPISIRRCSVDALLEMISSDTPPTSDIQEATEVPFVAA